MLTRRLAYTLALLLVTCSLSAQKQERKDSLVRLLGCNELQQTELYGVSYRKALGNARFEHNSTKLICDTAIWNVNQNVIHCNGHVKIIQNRTVLSSDKLDYLIDDNLAQFRGTLVQLQDKDKNTLRTHNLDYNTKDSLATFKNGASMRDKDGQIIESDEGSYDAKVRQFSFLRRVNMYTDSVFVKTDALDYNAGTQIAVFGTNTNAWRDENMLSAKSGWYDHAKEVFTFVKDVHMMTRSQEAWCDTLKYYRTPNDAEMFGHVELLDTTRNIAAVAGYMQYIDSLEYVKMARDPAVIAISTQDEKRDTAYMGADTIIYRAVPKCNVPEGEISASAARLKDLEADPVTEYRRKAAETAKAAAEEARKKLLEGDPNAAASIDPGQKAKGPILPAPWDEDTAPARPRWTFSPQLPDTLRKTTGTGPPDSLKLKGTKTGPPEQVGEEPAEQGEETAQPSDTTAQQDSVAPVPKDSTKIGFLLGIRNVKVFRNDMQVVCDSLAYNDLDSLIRLYKKPVVWNEIRRQYTADSITVIIKNQNIDRASLMSNAFIVIQEDSICYDQIKGTEMMAYFDTTGALKRFDALGGASGLFFIEENEALATVNKFESKMLTATFLDGNINDLNYFEGVKSDAYPVVQLKKDEKVLKGFEWQPDRRPKDPTDITLLTPRESEREKYEAIPQAGFPLTEQYFPGHMAKVRKMLAQQDSLKRERNARRKRLEEERKAAEEQQRILDSLKNVAAADSLKITSADSLATAVGDSLKTAIPDSLKTTQIDSLKTAMPDSLKTARADSLVAPETVEQDPKALKEAAKKAEMERKRAEKARQQAEKARQQAEKKARQEEREAKFEKEEAERLAAKAEKELKKERAKTLKALKALRKREAKEQKVLERYLKRYEKKKAREDAKAAKRTLKDKDSGEPVTEASSSEP